MFGEKNRLHINQKFKESDLNPWLLCQKCFSLGFLVMNLTDYLQVRAWAFTSRMTVQWLYYNKFHFPSSKLTCDVAH